MRTNYNDVVRRLEKKGFNIARFSYSLCYEWLKKMGFKTNFNELLSKFILMMSIKLKVSYPIWAQETNWLKYFRKYKNIASETVMYLYCLVEDYIQSESQIKSYYSIFNSRCQVYSQLKIFLQNSDESNINIDTTNMLKLILSMEHFFLPRKERIILFAFPGILRTAGIPIPEGIRPIKDKLPRKEDKFPLLEVERINKFGKEITTVGVSIHWANLGYQKTEPDPKGNKKKVWTNSTWNTVRAGIIAMIEKTCISKNISFSKFSIKNIENCDIESVTYFTNFPFYVEGVKIWLGWYATREFCDDETRNHIKKLLSDLASPDEIIHHKKITKVFLKPLELILGEEPLLLSSSDDFIKAQLKVCYRGCLLQRLRINIEMLNLKWNMIRRENNRVKRHEDGSFDFGVDFSKGNYGNTPPESPLCGLPAFADALDELLKLYEKNGYGVPSDDDYVICDTKEKKWSKIKRPRGWFTGKMTKCKAERFITQIYKKYTNAATPHDLGRSCAEIMERLMCDYGEREKFLDNHGRWGTRKRHYLPTREQEGYLEATMDCLNFPWEVEKCKDWLRDRGCDVESGKYPKGIRRLNEQKTSKDVQVSQPKEDMSEKIIKCAQKEIELIENQRTKGFATKRWCESQIKKIIKDIDVYRHNSDKQQLGQ